MTSCSIEQYSKDFHYLWDNILTVNYIDNKDQIYLILDKIDFLINKGVNINVKYGPSTPLRSLLSYHLSPRLSHHEYKEYTSEILDFLLSKNVIPDEDSIYYLMKMKNYKILEEILKRCDTTFDIFDYNSISPVFNDPLLIELLVGFNAIDVNKYDYINCISIESEIINYALYNDQDYRNYRKDVIRILKKNGSLQPSFNKMNNIIIKFENSKDEKEREILRNKFIEAYEYYISC